MQLTVFPLPFRSTLGDKVIFTFVSDRFLHCVHFWVFAMGRKYPPLYPFASLLQSDFHFHQHDSQARLVGKHSMSWGF